MRPPVPPSGPSFEHPADIIACVGGSLLAVFAHPDDETFGAGGALARAARQGVHVALVCATRGEVGEIADPEIATPETLGEVRERELRCAAARLGAAEVSFLGYRDSGMAGTPENDDPRAFARAGEAEVVRALVGHVRRLRPEVVLTFDADGGYGHPDHMAIHRHTMAAVAVAADPSAHPSLGPPWTVRRVFYPVIPRARFRELRERLAAGGVDAAFLADAERMLERLPDERVDVTLDVRGSVEAKLAALACHATQMPADHPFRALPEDLAREAMATEFFAIGLPEGLRAAPPADLFDGI